MSTLSIAIITKNEENNLARCLESIKWADEIVVVDSESTDRTREIAESYTNKIYTLPWLGYSKQKQYAIEKTSCDWILSLDADEEVPEKLQKEIQKVLTQKSYSAYSLTRKLVFKENLLNYAGLDRNILRLFKRNTAHFNDKLVHESLVTKERVGKLKNPLLHHSFKDLHELLEKTNHYSSLRAQTLGKPSSILSAFLHGLVMFLKLFFIKKGFLDGGLGFLFCMAFSQASFYTYAKKAIES